MTKKISAILLSLMMMIVFVPMMSFADGVTNTYISANGIDFSAGPVDPTNVYVWDYSSKELVLKGNIWQTAVTSGYDHNSSRDPISGSRYAIKVPDGTTIKLEKNSSIHALGSTNGTSMAIYAMGDLTIEPWEHSDENETLDIYTGVSGGTGDTYYAAGIWHDRNASSDALTIDNMPELRIHNESISTTNDGFYGIRFPRVEIVNDSTVEISGNAKTYAKVAIETGSHVGGFSGTVGYVNIDNSKVVIDNGDALCLNRGISTDGYVSCDASKLDVKTGDSDYGPYTNAIEAGGWINVPGVDGDISCIFNESVVSAEAGNLNIEPSGGEGKSAAIYTYEDSIYATKCVFNLKAGNVTSDVYGNTDSVAMNAENIYLSDSTANASSGVVNGISADSMALNADLDVLLYGCTIDLSAGSITTASTNNCYGVRAGHGIYLGYAGGDEVSGVAGKISAGSVGLGDSSALYVAGIEGPEGGHGIFIDNESKLDLKSGNGNPWGASSSGSSKTAYVGYGEINISGHSVVSAEASEAYDESSAFFVDNWWGGYTYSTPQYLGMRVNGESTVYAKSSTSAHGDSDAIIVETCSMYVEDSSKVTAIADDAYEDSTGICVEYAYSYPGWNSELGLYVEDSEICASAGSSYENVVMLSDNWESVGIFVGRGDLVAKNSKIYAEADKGYYASCGISVEGETYYAYTYGGDIKFTNTDVEAIAKETVEGRSVAICAEGTITSNNASTKSSEKTVITADAQNTGSDNETAAIMAGNSVDLYETDLILTVQGTETYTAAGIVAYGGIMGPNIYYGEQDNNNKKIYMQDCDATITVTGDMDLDQVMSGIMVGEGYVMPYSYPGEEPMNAVITNSKVDIDINGASGIMYGICSDYGNVLLTNGGESDVVDITVASDTSMFPQEYLEFKAAGIYAANDAKVKGTGKLTIDVDGGGTLTEYGIHGYNKVIVDTANVDIKTHHEVISDPVFGILAGDYAMSGPSQDAECIIKGKPELHIDSIYPIWSFGTLSVGTDDRELYLKNAMTIDEETITKASGNVAGIVQGYNDQLVSCILPQSDNLDGVWISWQSSSNPGGGGTGGGGGGSVDPQPTPTPTPADVDVDIDPIPAGTELTSETIGDNIEIKTKSGKELVEGKDYVVYVDKGASSTVGYKAVEIIGRGEYKDVSFPTSYVKVLPKTAAINTITAGAGKVAFKWKKVAGVDNYVVRIATNKNFTKNKVVKYTKGTTTAKTFKNLVSGKKYYVQVRALKKNIENPTTHKFEKFYGNWSKVKTVKPN